MKAEVPKDSNRVLRILVADNHDEFRRSLVKYLESLHDLQVVAEVRDGIQALNMARRMSPHLAILNIRMPKLDAWITAKAIKATHPHTFVIALSLGDMEEEEEFDAKSAIDGLLKQGQIARELPIVIERVRARITRL